MSATPSLITSACNTSHQITDKGELFTYIEVVILAARHLHEYTGKSGELLKSLETTELRFLSESAGLRELANCLIQGAEVAEQQATRLRVADSTSSDRDQP